MSLNTSDQANNTGRGLFVAQVATLLCGYVKSVNVLFFKFIGVLSDLDF